MKTPTQDAMIRASARSAAEKIHPEYSVDWWLTVARQSLQYQNLFSQACEERERIARIIDAELAAPQHALELSNGAYAEIFDELHEVRNFIHPMPGQTLIGALQTDLRERIELKGIIVRLLDCLEINDGTSFWGTKDEEACKDAHVAINRQSHRHHEA